MEREIYKKNIEDLRSKVDLFAHAVHPLYCALNWMWATYEERRTPHVYEIVNNLNDSLDALLKWGGQDESYEVGSGGLWVGYDEYEGYATFFMEFRFSERDYVDVSTQ